MVEDGSFIKVQPAERNGSKEDGPDVGSDLLETDELATEQMGDVDPDGVPSDAAVARDFPDLEVSGVLGRAELRGHGSGRGYVDGGRGLVVEGFMRPYVVEVGAELVEAFARK